MSTPALRSAVGRMAADVAGLLRQVEAPDGPGLGTWNMGELVVHMLHVFDFELAVARRDPIDPVFSLEDLGRFTQGYVNTEAERDPKAIADRVEKSATAFLDETAGAAPDDLYDWLGGARLPASVMHAHILSESQVHGWDVARRQRLPWPMRADDAVAALDGFVFPLATAFAECGGFGGGRAFVNQETAHGVRIRYEVRVVGAPPRHFVFDDGTLTITDPGSGKVDCFVRADPVAINLIAWGRMSPWPSVARGRLRAWGRKPWLAAKLTSLLSTP